MPIFELRASIPWGFLQVSSVPYGWIYVSIVAIITNIILGPVIYFVLDKFIDLFRRIKIIDKIYMKNVIRVQKKIFPKVEKYGPIALAFFIGIPLPGTGSYTGALAAYLLGIKKKNFFWINLIGVLIAGVLVTLVMLTGSHFFAFFAK